MKLIQRNLEEPSEPSEVVSDSLCRTRNSRRVVKTMSILEKGEGRSQNYGLLHQTSTLQENKTNKPRGSLYPVFGR